MRTYLTGAMCHAVIARPLRREDQPDGRIRFWGEVPCQNAKPRILRVVNPSVIAARGADGGGRLSISAPRSRSCCRRC
jgi:hypothetical protein